MIDMFFLGRKCVIYTHSRLNTLGTEKSARTCQKQGRGGLWAEGPHPMRPFVANLLPYPNFSDWKVYLWATLKEKSCIEHGRIQQDLAGTNEFLTYFIEQIIQKYIMTV